MRFLSKIAYQRTRQHRRAPFIGQFEQRMVFAAWVATSFPVGNVPMGSSLRIEAADTVSDFGTDVDSILSANSMSFSTASANGGAARPLTDLGFAYSPGAGVSGALVINGIVVNAEKEFEPSEVKYFECSGNRKSFDA